MLYNLGVLSLSMYMFLPNFDMSNIYNRKVLKIDKFVIISELPSYLYPSTYPCVTVTLISSISKSMNLQLGIWSTLLTFK